jgi:hypothetical protein
MLHSFPVRRKLFMHPAHRTVGVSGDAIVMRPYCRNNGFSANGLPIAPTCVHLVASRSDADACAARTLFEQAARKCCDIQYHHMEFDRVDAGSEGLADDDCAVVFQRGVHIVRSWADLDAASLVGISHHTGPADDNMSGDSEPVEVEIATTAQWHPVLEGVEPFASRHDVAQRHCIPEDATVLLIVRTAIEARPVAWIRSRRYGGVFSTSLGCSEDFRRPDFVRLTVNALTWVAGDS